MPSFADSIVLFLLALLLFGPKRLPVLARELGKWIGEFRRASNEFKMQMDEELRASEQAERQKQIAAMEAAAPLPPPLEEPEHPHLRHSAAPVPSLLAPKEAENSSPLPTSPLAPSSPDPSPPQATSTEDLSAHTPHPPRETADAVRPLPIAVSGELRMMPPATGLPTPRARNLATNGNALGGLLDSIPETSAPEAAFAETHTESSAHGD